MSVLKDWMTPQDKWQEKAGYKVKGFKLKKEIIQDFEDACKKANVSQASQISKMMQEFIDQTND